MNQFTTQNTRSTASVTFAYQHLLAFKNSHFSTPITAAFVYCSQDSQVQKLSSSIRLESSNHPDARTTAEPARAQSRKATALRCRCGCGNNLLLTLALVLIAAGSIVTAAIGDGTGLPQKQKDQRSELLTANRHIVCTWWPLCRQVTPGMVTFWASSCRRFRVRAAVQTADMARGRSCVWVEFKQSPQNSKRQQIYREGSRQVAAWPTRSPLVWPTPSSLQLRRCCLPSAMLIQARHSKASCSCDKKFSVELMNLAPLSSQSRESG